MGFKKVPFLFLNYHPIDIRTRNANEDVKSFGSTHKPYSMNIKTNIGKAFLNLLHKHFHSTHSIRKMLNKNMVKISYSCMSHVNSIISAHNCSIPSPSKANYGCNCRDKTNCFCKTSAVHPTLFTSVGNEKMVYLGVSEIPLKETYHNLSIYI